MISKKFIKNSIIYTVAGALPMASAIILLPVYIGYLTTPVYGSLILYTGFSLFIQIVVTYGFDASIYNYYHDYKEDKEKLSVFVSSVFTFLFIVGAIVAFFFALFGSWIFTKVYEDSQISFYPYGLIALVSGVFQALFKVNSSFLQTQEKAAEFLLQNLISFSLIAGLTILGLYLYPNDLVGPMMGRLIAVVLSGLWILFRIYGPFGFHFNFEMIKSTFGFNHPSLIYQIIQWFNSSYDRVVLKLYLPLSQVGIYDFAAKCLMAIEFIVAGFYTSFFPRVLSIVAPQKEKKTTVEINRYYNGLTAVTILLVVLSVFAMPLVLQWLIEFFNKPDYLDIIQWIPYIAITYLLRAIRLYIAMPYGVTKYAKPLPLFYTVIAVTKIAAMVLLIPRYGIHGVLFSTWLSYVVEVLILYFGIRNRFEIRFNVFKLVVAPLAIAVIIGIMEPVFGRTHREVVHAAYVVIAGLLLLWAFRNELKIFNGNFFAKMK